MIDREKIILNYLKKDLVRTEIIDILTSLYNGFSIQDNVNYTIFTPNESNTRTFLIQFNKEQLVMSITAHNCHNDALKSIEPALKFLLKPDFVDTDSVCVIVELKDINLGMMKLHKTQIPSLIEMVEQFKHSLLNI